MIETSITVVLSLCAVGAFAALAHETAAHHGLHLRVKLMAGMALVAVAVTASTCASRGLQWNAAGIAIAIACCGVSAVTDAQTGYVFDAVTYPATVLVVLLNALGGTIASSLGGALCGGAALGALYLLTRGRGIGLGDVKLALCIGAAAGPTAAVFTLGTAFVLGGAAGAYLLVAKRAERGDTIRFAPYLATAFLIIVGGRFA